MKPLLPASIVKLERWYTTNIAKLYEAKDTMRPSLFDELQTYYGNVYFSERVHLWFKEKERSYAH